MGYLVLKDYSQYIQGNYLLQLTQGDLTKRVVEENLSLQAIAQRLAQKYNLDAEFTPTTPYSTTKTYGAAARIVVDLASGGFTAYSALSTYTVGDLVIEAGVGYSCITAILVAEPFDSSKWGVIGAQHSIFYVAYPATCTLSGEPNPATLMSPYAPEFNYKNIYSKDDIVYRRGYTYSCNSASTVLSHQAALQYAQYTNLPFNNVFPDDPISNSNGQFWNEKTAYLVAAGSLTGKLYDAAATYTVGNTIMGADGNNLICNTAIPVPEAFDPAKWSLLWVAGDNRTQIIKDAMVRITVFKLSPLISPKNRPDVWLEDYRSILRELNEAAEGKITLSLPLKQPYNATRTYNGGNIKNVNNW